MNFIIAKRDIKIRCQDKQGQRKKNFLNHLFIKFNINQLQQMDKIDRTAKLFNYALIFQFYLCKETITEERAPKAAVPFSRFVDSSLNPFRLDTLEAIY